MTKASEQKVEKKNTKKVLPLEERMSRLEEVVEALGKPGVDLSEALKLYKEGVELADGCLEEIEGVEKELKILNTQEDEG